MYQHDILINQKNSTGQYISFHIEKCCNKIVWRDTFHAVTSHLMGQDFIGGSWCPFHVYYVFNKGYYHLVHFCFLHSFVCYITYHSAIAFRNSDVRIYLFSDELSRRLTPVCSDPKVKLISKFSAYRVLSGTIDKSINRVLVKE